MRLSVPIMLIRLARTGLPFLFLLIFAAAPESVASPSSQSRGERVCHLDAAEKRKSSNGSQQWAVRQIDRWCVRDGRVVSVRQTLEVDTGPGWRLESKSGTTRVTEAGSAISQGRFHLSKRRGGACFPRIAGTLEPDGGSEYSTDAGC